MFDMIVITVDYLGRSVFALKFIVIRFIVELFGLGEVFSDDGFEQPSRWHFERGDKVHMEL